MQGVQHIVVFVTVPGPEEAQTLGRVLLGKKLVACVNIVPHVDSLFWWEGKIDRAGECLLILKTRYSVFQALTEAVKAQHSYSVPEIIALPILAGQKDYLDWIDETVRS
ncbi:MAG TPA: divalent-cation tolerance protein CutA [Candidatus Omnitrophota bacterium]|nr:divalent-cation tolerance protein CutA [Candidatus Omnitrophota bacterium]